MELRNIKTFIRASELQSFSRAAEDLGYSQATVTVQIRQLEEELGTPLFERIGRHVYLTDQGQVFRSYATNIIETIDTAEHALKENPAYSGTLRVAASESICADVLSPVLTELHNEYPEIAARIFTVTNDRVFEMLEKNDADLAYFLDRRIHRDNMTKVFEHREPMLFTASADNPLTKKRDVPLKEIARMPLILTEKGLSYRNELEDAAGLLGVDLVPSLEIGNTNLIVQTLVQTDTISYLPQYVVRGPIREGRLGEIRCSEVKTELWSQLVHHRSKLVTPQMRLFIDILKKIRTKHP